MSPKKCHLARPEVIKKSAAHVAAELRLPRPKGAKSSTHQPRLIVGRREWLTLPHLGLENLRAKIDTGARSSSLHAEDIVLFQKNNQSWVRFTTGGHHGESQTCEAPLLRTRTVRSSNGQEEQRHFIETPATTTGGFTWKIQLSLTHRGTMKNPLLLGRRALAGIFIVDPQRTNLLGSPDKNEPPNPNAPKS